MTDDVLNALRITVPAQDEMALLRQHDVTLRPLGYGGLSEALVAIVPNGVAESLLRQRAVNWPDQDAAIWERARTQTRATLAGAECRSAEAHGYRFMHLYDTRETNTRAFLAFPDLLTERLALPDDHIALLTCVGNGPLFAIDPTAPLAHWSSALVTSHALTYFSIVNDGERGQIYVLAHSQLWTIQEYNLLGNVATAHIGDLPA